MDETMITKDLDILLQKRCSIRKYREETVSDNDILSCIKAAGLAPSARNNQPWRFVIVKDTLLRDKVAETIPLPIESNTFRQQSPIFVVLVQEIPAKPMPPDKHTHEYFVDIDHGLAAAFFCLKATALGLGTCIIGAFDERKLKEILKIPKEKKVKIMIALGHPAQNYDLKTVNKCRKNLADIVCLDQYL